MNIEEMRKAVDINLPGTGYSNTNFGAPVAKTRNGSVVNISLIEF
jgi:hypothetical protein